MSQAKEFIFDSRIGADVIRVKPGEYAVTNEGQVLFTVLGSCVAVCLMDIERAVVGLNHFMLPNQSIHSADPFNRSARYGANAMELLINECMARGARRSHLVAKLYGGAAVLNNISDIGAVNIAFAQKYLATEGIRVVDSMLGGTTAYRLYLFGANGQTEVKRLEGFQRLSALNSQSEKTVSEVINKKLVTTVPELFVEKF